jgi:hypothetical protein
MHGFEATGDDPDAIAIEEHRPRIPIASGGIE